MEELLAAARRGVEAGVRSSVRRAVADGVSAATANIAAEPHRVSAAWYRSAWFHAVLFVLLPYVQVPLMWIQQRFALWTRIALTLAAVVYLGVVVLTMPDKAPDGQTSSLRFRMNSMQLVTDRAEQEAIVHAIWDASGHDAKQSRLCEEHFGKRFRVEGRVDAVSYVAEEDLYYLFLMPPDPIKLNIYWYSAPCRYVLLLPASERELLASIDTGQTIAAEGCLANLLKTEGDFFARIVLKEPKLLR